MISTSPDPILTMNADAARRRMRDLVAQTEMVQRHPAASLPHYPLWDMNRGFGL